MERLDISYPQAPQVRSEFRQASLSTSTARHLVLFGQHETLMDKQLLPAHTAALFLESCSDWTALKNPYKQLEQDPQYRSIVARAAELGTPICFADPHISRRYELLDLVVVGTETAAAIALWAAAARPFFKKAPQIVEGVSSRRRFLKSLGLGAAGTYLASPILSGTLCDLPGEAFTQARLLSRKLHPEYMIFLLTFRDLVVSYKVQWFSENRLAAQRNGPLVVTVLGAQHQGYEHLLARSQEEKLRSIGRFSSYLPSLVATPETFYTILAGNSEGQMTRIEVPQLKALWERSNEGARNPRQISHT